MMRPTDPSPKPIEIISCDGRTRRFRSVHEACEILHCSSRTIRRRIEDGHSLEVMGNYVKVRYIK